jgi:hypothetical protein
MQVGKNLTVEYLDGVVITRRQSVWIYIFIIIFSLAVLFAIFTDSESGEDQVYIQAFVVVFQLWILTSSISKLYTVRVISIKDDVVSEFYYLYNFLMAKRIKKLIQKDSSICWKTGHNGEEELGTVKIIDGKNSVCLFRNINPLQALSTAKEIAAYLAINFVVCKD